MSVRLTKDTTYLTGNEGQKFCAVFSVAKLERFHHCTANDSRPFYPCGKCACAYNFDSTRSACSVYLEGTRSHNEGRVSTLASNSGLMSNSSFVSRIFHDSRLLAYTFVGHNFMFGHLLLQNEMYTDHVTK